MSEWQYKGYGRIYVSTAEDIKRVEKILDDIDHDEWEFWALLDILGCKIKYIPGTPVSIFGIHDKTKWWGP